jgi:glycosyltransferase involved in cell wall biosynthesis
MNKILNITTILPVPFFENKRRENDIILETEKQLKANGYDIDYVYLFVFPRVNRFLTFFKKKWKEYFILQRKGSFLLRDKYINTIAAWSLPFDSKLKWILNEISYQLNKKRIYDLIQHHNPVLVHAQSIGFESYLAYKIYKRYNIPYIITARGIKNGVDRKTLGILNHAQAHIAVSIIQKKHIEKILKREVNLIPHGLDDHFFIKRPQEFKTETLKLIFVGRLLKFKNIDLVISALSMIHSEFIFDIYGEGPEENYLKHLVDSYKLSNKVFFNGYIPHEKLPSVLPNYHLFVMPSHPETLGRVYFEAMACGLPVIATRNTGIDGIITHSKQGFLINPVIEELYNIFNEILNDLKILHKMSHCSYETACNYKWSIIAEKYYRVYTESAPKNLNNKIT